MGPFWAEAAPRQGSTGLSEGSRGCISALAHLASASVLCATCPRARRDSGHWEPPASACSGVEKKKTASLGSGGAGRPGWPWEDGFAAGELEACWLGVRSPRSWADLHRKARQKAPAIQRARMATHFLGKSYDRKEMTKRSEG